MGTQLIDDYESYDCGFSCPSCGEYTESSYCLNCNVDITSLGESTPERLNPLASSIIESVDCDNIIKTNKIQVNSTEYEFYGARTDGSDLVFFLKVLGEDLKIVCNPHAKKSIKKISKKGKTKRKMVSNELFSNIRTIIGLFKREPQRYGLEKLRVFQH